MRTKIKLINICIRHKCTKYGDNTSVNTYKQYQTKIIRRAKKNEKPRVAKTAINSKPGTSQFDRPSDIVSYDTISNNESISDGISDDVGMRMLHRPRRKVESPKIEYEFMGERANTVLMTSPLNSEEVQENTTYVHNTVESHNEITETDAKNIQISVRNREKSEDHSFFEMPEVLPTSVSNSNKNPIENDITFLETKDPMEDIKKVVNNGETRFNELNMQMLSRRLHEQIFTNSKNKDQLSNKKLMILREELVTSGMNIDDVKCLPDVNIDLPSFQGNDIEEHFHNIARDQIKPYKKIIHKILEGIPEMPEKWLLQEGWTRYSKDKVERVDHPCENGMIFDVEVCMKEGPLPTLATAVTKDAWYGWVSPSLVEGTSMPVESLSLTTDVLIPLESTINEHGKKLSDYHKKPKIIIGHNVSYDRRRIKEQYWLNCTGARFVDTMSLHVSVSGLNSYQRVVLKTEKHEGKQEDWEKVTSLNGLSDVYKLYCDQELDKNPRELFVEGTLMEIRENFDELIKYCAQDVIATHEVLKKVFPLFEERFPHPVTLAGMLELGSAYLPVNSNWQRYIEESQSTFEDLNYEAKNSLSKRADEVCKLIHNNRYEEDLWMWDQDWSVQPINVKASLTKTKREEADKELAHAKMEESDFEKYLTDGEDEIDPLEEEFDYLKKTRYFLPARVPHMSGYPAWYRKLCQKNSEENWLPGPHKISTSMQVVPKLLNLTWENYPLHYIREHGWGFLVPYKRDTSIETTLPLEQLLAQCPLPESGIKRDSVDYAMTTLSTDVQNDLTNTEFWRRKKKKVDNEYAKIYKGSGIWCNVDIDDCCWFFKLPHKDGAARNVGNPLARDFLNKFSENVLAGLDASASQVLQIAKTVSYWRNNRDRIMSQMVVWLNEESLPNVVRKRGSAMRYGAIIPQVVVSGTLTRRATEPTWMTASNASVERVGSELRAMVQAPPGYNIVGADVDSQELWIASVVGDSHCAGIHGATPFGWMTLIGTKSNGTDMHSVTAKAIGISRDHAKVINYARIYGAGQKFAERLLKQFNPSMTESEAASKSRKMFALTKGKKVYRLKTECLNEDLDDVGYTSYDTFKLAKVHGKRMEEMFDRGQWLGGTESAMFNRLEEIAGSPMPVTPFLNSRLSRALEFEEGKRDDKYLPTKINWVVQSGAVDFLHLMLVCMRWLMQDNARFCLSFHDEVRYIVPTKYKYNAALAMHITNLLTRAFCSSRLGIKDLPMSVAFFASVEVDTVLRKESSIDCKTPSNPHGLENGYGIPTGESLDIWKAIEKSGGTLGPWLATRIQKRQINKNTEQSS